MQPYAHTPQPYAPTLQPYVPPCGRMHPPLHPSVPQALIGKVTQGAKAGVKGAKEAGGAASAGVASQKNKLVKQKSSLGTAGGGALKRQGTATDMV